MSNEVTPNIRRPAPEEQIVRGWAQISRILGWSIRQVRRLVEADSVLAGIIRVDRATGSPFALRSELLRYVNDCPRWSEGGRELNNAKTA